LLPIKPLLFLLILLTTPVYALEAPTQPWEVIVIEEEIIKEEEKWVDVDDSILCNCYKFVTNKIGVTIPMAKFIPNSEPLEGGVVIEYFGDLKHVSYIKQVEEDGVLVEETNYHHCQYGERFIPFTSSRLVGFWHSY